MFYISFFLKVSLICKIFLRYLLFPGKWRRLFDNLIIFLTGSYCSAQTKNLTGCNPALFSRWLKLGSSRSSSRVLLLARHFSWRHLRKQTLKICKGQFILPLSTQANHFNSYFHVRKIKFYLKKLKIKVNLAELINN